MSPTRGNRSLATRAPDAVHERVERAAAKAGVPKAAWLLAAIEEQLDQEEAHERAMRRPTPRAIVEASPRISNGRLIMPTGRSFER